VAFQAQAYIIGDQTGIVLSTALFLLQASQ